MYFHFITLLYVSNDNPNVENDNKYRDMYSMQSICFECFCILLSGVLFLTCSLSHVLKSEPFEKFILHLAAYYFTLNKFSGHKSIIFILPDFTFKINFNICNKSCIFHKLMLPWNETRIHNKQN